MFHIDVELSIVVAITEPVTLTPFFKYGDHAWMACPILGRSTACSLLPYMLANTSHQ